MFRRILCGIALLSLVLSLCGCDILTADTAELLSPPALSGDLKPIDEVIKKTAGGDYTLKYPSRGTYRSAVVREDIDGDGIPEAFAFYSMAEGETYTMNINAISKKSGEWKSVAIQKIVAGGVDKIEFCDLDSDGVKEILVGWEIYGTSEMQLAVYSLSGNSLTQRMLQKYVHFITCDLDESGKNEVLLIKSSAAEQINTASLFALSEEGITEVSFCELDSTAKTVNEPVLSTLSTGKPAVYIDEIKGVGAVTEVLIMEKGNLVNPLYDPDTKETTKTLRSVSFQITDINNDGIIEIPVQENIPAVTRQAFNEKLYLTNWCSFNGEVLVNQMTTMINVIDSYYYKIPAKWVGNIAVLKDTDSAVREIYSYDPQNMTVGDSLIEIKAVKARNYEARKYKEKGYTEIMSNDKTVFICKISKAAEKDGISIESIKSDFKFLE